MLPLWGGRINSVVVKSSTSRFLDTESFDNRMITITKREECHASTECLSIRAAHQHFVLFLTEPTLAAEVTPDRLINADKEPHNWLMNHRTYDAQRYSQLDKINKTNVKSLKLAYAVALGGTSTNENLQST